MSDRLVASSDEEDDDERLNERLKEQVVLWKLREDNEQDRRPFAERSVAPLSVIAEEHSPPTSVSRRRSPSQDYFHADFVRSNPNLHFRDNSPSDNSVGNSPIWKLSCLQKTKLCASKTFPSILVPTGIRSGNPFKFTEFPDSYKTPNYCDCGQSEYLNCMSAWNDQTRLLAWQSRRSDVLLPGIIRNFHNPPAWFPKTKLKWTQKLQKEATEAVDKVLKMFLRKYLDRLENDEENGDDWKNGPDIENIPHDISDLLYYYEMHPLQKEGTFESHA